MTEPSTCDSDTVRRLRRRLARERQARLEAETIAERFTRAATHDPLTGLANRAAVLDRLEVALQTRSEHRHEVGLLFLDLDDFKLVNDRHGHLVGDEVLVAVARRLVECTRSSDTVARLGGDEFVVMCDHAASTEEVQRLAQRILNSMHEPLRLSGMDVTLTVSIGIQVAGISENAEGLLRDADAAMYAAKTGGKGRAVLFDGTALLPGRRSSALEKEFRQALGTGQVTMWLQPIVRLADGRVTAAEALARWDHPVRGPVSPAEFIPVAEASGLIVDLDRLAVAEACRHATQRGFEASGVGVNVNAAVETLQDPSYVREVTRILRSSRLSPRLLTIEITERSLVTDDPVLHENLASLRSQGVRLAIDDFGQEYSSFAYLRRLPVDVLKVDRSFVSGVGVVSRDEALVGAIVAVARALGMRTVAEGVETGVQAAALVELGMDEGQGWFFGRPSPADDWIGFAALPRQVAIGEHL